LSSATFADKPSSCSSFWLSRSSAVRLWAYAAALFGDARPEAGADR
jgi:hypothetical protein